MLESRKVLELLDRLNGIATPLGTLLDGNCYRGITTGFNDAYIIDAKTRRSLVGADGSCSEIIKPFLRGEDVRRYTLDAEQLWIIFTRRGINIDAYPAIRRHLAQMGSVTDPQKHRGRGWKKTGAYQWYEIQDDTAYFEFFDRPKIIYPDIAKSPRFFLDEKRHYPANTVYCIGSGDRRLLGFLNSRLFWFLISRISIPFGTRAGKYRYRLISSTWRRFQFRSSCYLSERRPLSSARLWRGC